MHKKHRPKTPPTPDTMRIQHLVEILCEHGCTAVREIIIELEAGRPVAQTEALSAEERARVLAELKAIMAVYDEPPPPGGNYP